MDLNAAVIFAAVVEAGSFTAAADQLDMPKSTVSRKISELERSLGARLLQRTTRRLSLTDAGRAFFGHAARAAAELASAERAVSELHATPRGVLRVTAPVGLDFLGPIAAGFMDSYPEVQLELVCTDRVVDLVDEGYDVAIRAGHLADSSLIARRVATWRGLVVAGEAYVARRGEPSEPAELVDHDCLAFAAGFGSVRWSLRSREASTTVELTPRLACNDLAVLEEATRAGLGIALLPAFRCGANLGGDNLRRILSDWFEPEVPLHAVYPSRRHLAPAVAAFVDHLRAALASPPWAVPDVAAPPA